MVFNSTESNYYGTCKKHESSIELVEWQPDLVEINPFDSSFNFEPDLLEGTFFADCKNFVDHQLETNQDSLKLILQDCSQRTFHDIDCFPQPSHASTKNQWAY